MALLVSLCMHMASSISGFSIPDEDTCSGAMLLDIPRRDFTVSIELLEMVIRGVNNGLESCNESTYNFLKPWADRLLDLLICAEENKDFSVSTELIEIAQLLIQKLDM